MFDDIVFRYFTCFVVFLFIFCHQRHLHSISETSKEEKKRAHFFQNSRNWMQRWYLAMPKKSITKITIKFLFKIFIKYLWITWIKFLFRVFIMDIGHLSVLTRENVKRFCIMLPNNYLYRNVYKHQFSIVFEGISYFLIQ